MKALILLALLLPGCAVGFTRGSTEKVTASDTTVTETTSHRGFQIVIGQGVTSAKTEPKKGALATANTGFSANAGPTFTAMGKAVGQGFAAGSGVGAVTTGVDALAEGAKARREVVDNGD